MATKGQKGKVDVAGKKQAGEVVAVREGCVDVKLGDDTVITVEPEKFTGAGDEE